MIRFCVIVGIIVVALVFTLLWASGPGQEKDD